MRKIRYSCVASLILGALASFACSEGPSSVSPVAPSLSNIAPQSPSSQPSSTLAAAAARWKSLGGSVVAAADGLVVDGTDVITAVTGSCPNLVITIRGTPVTVNSSTVFGSGTTCAGLAINTNVHVTGLLSFGTGGTATVVATNVSVVVATTETVTGTIASISGSCPSVTVTLTGLGGIIVTSPTTTFAPTGSCSTLAAGRSIEATGTRNATLQLAATLFSVVTSTPGTETVAGTIANISGSCPAKTVTLEGQGGVVVTSSTTTFTPTGSCATLAAGQTIEATGTRNATQQLLATAFDVEQDVSAGVPVGHGHQVTGEGIAAHVTGTCPSLSMVVLGVHLTTNASTVFLNGTCAAIRNGTKVTVMGDTRTDGSVTATSVRIGRQPGNKS